MVQVLLLVEPYDFLHRPGLHTLKLLENRIQEDVGRCRQDYGLAQAID